MNGDSLAEMPPDSVREVVAALKATLGVDPAAAMDLIRSAEPLWDAMEHAGGFVDSWGGREFCRVLPLALEFIRTTANAS